MILGRTDTPRTYHLVDTPRKMSWLIDQLKSASEIAYDIETSNPTIKAKKVKEYVKNTPIHVIGISYAWGRSPETISPFEFGNAAYIPLVRSDDSSFWGSSQDAIVNAVKEIQESSIPKCAHNGKFDSKELFRKLGIRTANFWFDTMLAGGLLDEEGINSSHALKSKFDRSGKISKIGMSDYYLDAQSSLFKSDLEDALTHYDPLWRRYSKVPLDILYPYACADTDLTLALRFVLSQLLVENGTDWVFQNIVMPLSHSVMMMELHGVPLHIGKARKVEAEHLKLQQDIQKEVCEMLGVDINVGSPQQLGDVLFNIMKLEGGIRNKNGWAVGVDVLQRIDHPVKEPLLRYRRSEQIQSTYATPAIEMAKVYGGDGSIGMVHPDFFLISKTGRLKCREPNLQNLPRPANGGDIVKGMWECPDGYTFVFADYSQMELRVAAHLSQEPSWIHGFTHGVDMHSATAHSIFHLDCDVSEVDAKYPEFRSKAKTINFGILYGETPFSISPKLNMTVEDADHLINTVYFGNSPTLKKWIDDTHLFAKTYGYVLNMFNRKRHLPDAMLNVPFSVKWPEERPKCYRGAIRPGSIDYNVQTFDEIDENELKSRIKKFGSNIFFKCLSCEHLKSCFWNTEIRIQKQKKEAALRQAVNTRVQGSAADLSSLALIKLSEGFKQYNLRANPVLYIHDEIGCFVHEHDVENVKNLMEYIMTTWLSEYTKFSVPLSVDFAVAKNWGDK